MSVVGEDGSFAGDVVFIADHKHFLNAHFAGVEHVEPEHFSGVALSPLGRSDGVPAVAAPGAEDWMVDMMTEVYYSHQSIVAFSNRKICRGWNFGADLPAGISVFSQVTNIDPFTGRCAVPKSVAACELVVIVPVCFKDFIFEVLKFTFLPVVCFCQKNQVVPPVTNYVVLPGQ